MKGHIKYTGLAPYTSVVLKLLVNPVYSEDSTHWNMLLTYQKQIQDYLGHIGLAIEVQEMDGYAYLYQPEIEDEEGAIIPLPRITRRDRLTFHATLLCALLRERLDQHETQNLDTEGCFISEAQIRELMFPLLPERTDVRKVERRIEAAINQVSDLGFLKRLGTQQNISYFEIRRILKAKMNAEKLAEIAEKLQHYGSIVLEEPEHENDV
ncbi:MAG TPA: DUF4194 domain-containing protein [Ktedonobacteraceae bacterium]|nr:DUF4194 domain-containing protein [Ktedonobacteraceae bacterium]